MFHTFTASNEINQSSLEDNSSQPCDVSRANTREPPHPQLAITLNSGLLLCDIIEDKISHNVGQGPT
jgi:hypothetical protein